MRMIKIKLKEKIYTYKKLFMISMKQEQLDLVLMMIFYEAYCDVPHLCLNIILELMGSKLKSCISYKSCEVKFQIFSYG